MAKILPRNTPRDIIFDMEDDIGTLRRHANILLCLSTDQGLEDVLQDALHQVASGLSVCHRDLRDKFTRLFEQIVRTDGDKPEPVKAAEKMPASAPDAQPTIRDLCHRWDVARARLDLDLLESSGVSDKEADRIMDAARERHRAIEQAILATDPDDIRDVDMVMMLRMARKVIGDDDFTDEQEGRCHQMLELIDTVLSRRVDWTAPAG